MFAGVCCHLLGAAPVARRIRRLSLRAGRCGIVVGAITGSALLFHCCFVEVPSASDELVPNAVLSVAEGPVVSIVVIVNDLEGPPAGKDIAANQIGLEPIGELRVAGVA